MANASAARRQTSRGLVVTSARFLRCSRVLFDCGLAHCLRWLNAACRKPQFVCALNVFSGTTSYVQNPGTRMKRLEAFVEQPVDFRAPIGESIRKPTFCHFVVPMDEAIGVGFVTLDGACTYGGLFLIVTG